MDTFGQKLRKLRTERNKMQKEVAIDLSVSKTCYSSYENDIRMPGIEMLIKIADYYKVSIDYLLNRDKKININKIKLSEDINEIKNKIIALENYVKETK
jgi:transcriptional regulator with XRE-family HTH domain